MKKMKLDERIRTDLGPGEGLLGFFVAQIPFKFWWFFLVGPIAVLGIKTYYIAASDKGMHFYGMNIVGQIEQHDYFPYDAIRVLEMKSGWMQMPLRFEFKNHNELKVRAQRKGAKTVPKLTDDLINTLKEKLKVRC
jgi:RNAse (barnase) inhibitor barstar